MILEAFRLHRPRELREAVQLRAELGADAMLYAGGTELLLVMKLGLIELEHMIDLKRCAELRGIERRDGVLRIGATTTHREIERDGTVAAALPALAELARNVANVRVRAAGTLGGNLAFAEPHADPPALLAALGARVELTGPQGVRRVGIDAFHLGAFETALGDDEILSAVEVPLPAPDVRAAYRKIAVLERPTVGVAVAGPVAAGAFTAAPAVVVGAVDERPIHISGEQLAGATARDADALRAVATAACDAVDPVDDLAGSAEYKRHLTGVLVERTLRAVLEEGA